MSLKIRVSPRFLGWYLAVSIPFVGLATTIDPAFPGFADQPVVAGLINPTAMAFAPDGRLFVCQQQGALRVIANGSLLPDPFVTVNTDSSGERGLLGIAFDPDFAQNHFVYVYYTVPANSVPGHASAFNRVSRFTANGNLAVAGSERAIFELTELGPTHHNGGAIHFGLDGKLYVAAGENEIQANAQSFNTTLGKILRINSDGSIPPDNPFLAQTTGNQQAIWAMGLRNPYTFAVQPGTGIIYINDVGADAWEEINLGTAGANYGWPATEGFFTQSAYPQFTNPLYVYPHFSDDRGGCAISGGTFYNPETVTFPPIWTGRYFFADLCTGWIRYFDPASGESKVFARGVANPVDLKTGPNGALYYLARSAGAVRRIQYGAPVILQQPQGLTIAAGQSATFTVSATGVPVLHYTWRRNGQLISGANQASYTIASVTALDSGAQFTVEIANDFGLATSNTATLMVVGPPAQPSGPTPADNSQIDGLNPVLTWQGADGATAFDIYFGTTPQPPAVLLGSTIFSYAPQQTLARSTNYYWRIVAKNAYGSTSSPVWTFRTSAAQAGLRFVPITPCRVVDTRPAENVPAPFGPPALSAGAIRTFVLPVGRCGIPSAAKAYSLNVTVVPAGALSYLTLWPAGQVQPLVSTMNSFDGRVVANAAIVSAGTDGGIDVFATDQTDLILDINGYFVVAQ